MPLDGHSYLVSQGWGGKGKGLRDGAICRPIAVTQKKSLAGLGKDRDEAFPFWDHLFTAAASAIKVHIDDSDDEGSASSGDHGEAKKSRSTSLAFKRTETGILSTRRPVHGISAHDGLFRDLNTFVFLRDAARRGLYSRFFRGPVLGPDARLEKQVRESSPKPQYGVGEGEETTVRAMMVRQLENAKKERKERSKEKEKKDKVEENEEDFKRRKEDKTERKRVKEEKRAEERKRKEERRVVREAKEAGPASEVEEGKEKKEKSSKGKEKASEVSEFTPISTSSGDKKASSKDRERSSKKGKTDTDSDRHSERKGSKKSKRKLDGEDEDGAPKKKKKRKSDESELFVQ
ncbi:hypothetical protein FA13DRAFT_1784494 [Coprinellus micaceus]|uniref:G-patch domain-containing protein n=1 Tax=Coprinellus micaceus TaxID=71717 RepID=A0A4Y7U071_COPMI|nr:hypothetical protein FA13DRAFT_1784494 [Coprinellus micaceus]